MKKTLSVTMTLLLGLGYVLPALASLSTPGANEAEPAAKPSNQVVGNLPYSNQWVFNQRQSFLYLSANRGTLSQPFFRIDKYVADFNNTDFIFPSVDYFVGLFSFTSPESSSFVRGFSIWSRYGMGLGIKHGNLRNDAFSVQNSAESAYLTALMFRAGLSLTYDLSAWIQPYAGFELAPFVYRHSSSLSGAEAQGGGSLMGPVAGIHLPLFFSHRASLYGEFRRDMVLSDERNVFGSGSTLTAGMGMVF